MTYAYVLLSGGGLVEGVYTSLAKAFAAVSGCDHWQERTKPGESRWWSGIADAFDQWEIEQFAVNEGISQ